MANIRPEVNMNTKKELGISDKRHEEIQSVIIKFMQRRQRAGRKITNAEMVKRIKNMSGFTVLERLYAAFNMGGHIERWCMEDEIEELKEEIRRLKKERK